MQFFSGLDRLTVLLVDDNSHMLHIVRTMMRGFGIVHIFESRDPAEAIDIARNDSIDLIILDYQMDMLDGLEFTRMLRTAADSHNRFVPIILLTAYTERSRILSARDAGVTEICAKPINASELWRKIAACVNEPRPFVRTKTFFGPDRRRRTIEWPAEKERRKTPIEAPQPQAPDGETAPRAAGEASSPAAEATLEQAG
ncbi:response regulator [Marinicauda pacifica]|uniref:response regulator n=1 Tax=Marinicauda pacifica TaxID=1133559 RepID=UPI0035C86486